MKCTFLLTAACVISGLHGQKDAPVKKKSKSDQSDHAVIFYCYPKLLFSWPLIVIGPLFWLLGAPNETGDISGRLEVLGWLYLVATVLVLLTISVDPHVLTAGYPFLRVVADPGASASAVEIALIAVIWPRYAATANISAVV